MRKRLRGSHREGLEQSANEQRARETFQSGKRLRFYKFVSAGDILVTLAIVLLYGEVIKSTRIGLRTVVAHALSLILFLAMLIEFMLVKQAATATFFLLLVVSFFDVLGGFAVTLRSVQRDITVEGVENFDFQPSRRGRFNE